jgi:hypothetical protein
MAQVAVNYRNHWAERRKVCAELDPVAYRADLKAREVDPNHKWDNMGRSLKAIYLVSLQPNEKGEFNMCICKPWDASGCLRENTHRVATEQEAKAWEAEQAAKRQGIEDEKDHSERASAKALGEILRDAMLSAPAEEAGAGRVATEQEAKAWEAEQAAKRAKAK